MGVKNDYHEWVLEQLGGGGRISSKRMFGAVGLYRDGVFFAIISDDSLYFKVGDANRPEYVSRRARQFRPLPDKQHTSMSYYEVPAEILEDGDACAVWAERAVSDALASKIQPRRKPVRRR